MNFSSVELLRCTKCERDKLELVGFVGSDPQYIGRVVCESCNNEWLVEKGIVHVASKEGIREKYPDMERQARIGAYFYDQLLGEVETLFGMSENEMRGEYLNLVELGPGINVLDVGIGTGAEIGFLAQRAPGLEQSWRVCGVDISLEMLQQCEKKYAQRGISLDLFVAFAERLPFKDNTFDVVFHTGAINEFHDQKIAIEEMIRVAKPGTRIVISDEWLTEENSKQPIGSILLRAFPSISMTSQLPTDCVPEDVEEKKFESIWKGYGYCLHFRKPAR